MNHNRYFEIARKQSLLSTHKTRVGACIVKKNKIISYGHNNPKKTHPLAIKYNKYKGICAEMDCIIGHNRTIFKGAIIYVYRELKNGTIANAKPCHACMDLIKDCKIKRIYYTNNKQKVEICF